MILVSIPRFLGARNTWRQLWISLTCRIIMKLNSWPSAVHYHIMHKHRISFSAFSFDCHPPPQYRRLDCCLDSHSFQFGKGHMQQCRGVHSVCSCIERICIHLQLQWIIFNSSSGAALFCVIIGIKWSFSCFHPHSVGFISFESTHVGYGILLQVMLGEAVQEWQMLQQLPLLGENDMAQWW